MFLKKKIEKHLLKYIYIREGTIALKQVFIEQHSSPKISIYEQTVSFFSSLMLAKSQIYLNLSFVYIFKNQFDFIFFCLKYLVISWNNGQQKPKWFENLLPKVKHNINLNCP